MQKELQKVSELQQQMRKENHLSFSRKNEGNKIDFAPYRKQIQNDRTTFPVIKTAGNANHYLSELDNLVMPLTV